MIRGMALLRILLVGCAVVLGASAQMLQANVLRNLEYAHPESGPLALDLYLRTPEDLFR
jgi:hypothetical protein